MENTLNAALKGAIKNAGLKIPAADMDETLDALVCIYDEGATGKPLHLAIQGELDCDESEAESIAELFDELHQQEADEESDADDDDNEQNDD